MSPLLFNLVLEILATNVRSKAEIRRIQLASLEHKIALYAGDAFFSSMCSLQPLYEVLGGYVEISGYKVIY